MESQEPIQHQSNQKTPESELTQVHWSFRGKLDQHQPDGFKAETYHLSRRQAPCTCMSDSEYTVSYCTCKFQRPQPMRHPEQPPLLRAVELLMGIHPEYAVLMSSPEKNRNHSTQHPGWDLPRCASDIGLAGNNPGPSAFRLSHPRLMERQTSNQALVRVRCMSNPQKKL